MIKYKPFSLDYQFLGRTKSEAYDKHIFTNYRLRECLYCHSFIALSKDEPELQNGVCPYCAFKDTP